MGKKVMVLVCRVTNFDYEKHLYYEKNCHFFKSDIHVRFFKCTVGANQRSFWRRN